MPNRRVTIILNSNQNKRITVLIPLPTPSQLNPVVNSEGDEDNELYSFKELILTQARNKFRDKYLNTIYRWGGTPLEDTSGPNGEFRGLPEGEEEVLVSKGEAYIGPPKKKTRDDGKKGSVNVLAKKAFVHEDAIKQLQQVALLEGVHAAIGMPDLHKGDRFPIGCAIAAEGIYPALIGSDIGCGIALYPLGGMPSHLTPEKLASRLVGRGLDGEWKPQENENGVESLSLKKWLQLYGIEQETEFDSSLGTIGAGNHFAEILTVEEIIDSEACDSMGITQQPEGKVNKTNMYLLVHTGSRGLGASILRHYTKSDANPYFPPGHEEYEGYLEKHNHAVKWAQANRDLVAWRIRECLFGRDIVDDGDEVISVNDEEEEDDDRNEVESETGAKPYNNASEDPREELNKILDVTHNSVVRCGYQLTPDSGSIDVWVHRKGAAPSDRGFVPCPGSRGAFSWVLQPSGNGQSNAHSLPHGAGKALARNAHSLRKGVSSSDSHSMDKLTKSLTNTPLGSYVVCTNPDLLIEERPEAYKDIQCVVDDVEEFGIGEGVVCFRPFVTFKTAEERRK